MKNITVSITDLQHRRIRIWAAQRNCSASFIVRRVLEDLPKVARALQALNAYELEKMGIRPNPESQALVDFLKPVPRNKKLTQLNPAKTNIRKQPTQDQPVTFAIVAKEDTVIDCGTVREPRRRQALNPSPAVSTPIPAWQSADRPRLLFSAEDRAAGTPGDR
jgi:hypothetical protein